MSQWTTRLALILGFMVLTLLFASFWLPMSITTPSSTEIRAAMDIGSGATNLKVAKVDPTTGKIISKIYEQSIPVPYQKHLEFSPNNTFDREVMEQGILAIKNLKKVADAHHAKKVVAVATAAFRQADNAKEFAQEIENQTGVQVQIIDQDEEGILAFRGALAVTPHVEPAEVVTWDIGGGSMQLTTLSEQGAFLIEKGQTASIPFKNAIIQQIKGNDIQAQPSPNPLNQAEVEQALHYAQQKAQQTDSYIKDKINTPTTQVLGVGSLFNYGILRLVHQDQQMTVTQEQLKKAIQNLVDKTDADMVEKGPLAEVSVSNPLLVLGYMQALNIPQVDIVNINNADGALTYPPYWEK